MFNKRGKLVLCCLILLHFFLVTIVCCAPNRRKTNCMWDILPQNCHSLDCKWSNYVLKMLRCFDYFAVAAQISQLLKAQRINDNDCLCILSHGVDLIRHWFGFVAVAASVDSMNMVLHFSCICDLYTNNNNTKNETLRTVDIWQVNHR